VGVENSNLKVIFSQLESARKAGDDDLSHQKLVEYLREMKLTQAQLARRMGVGQSTISQVVRRVFPYDQKPAFFKFLEHNLLELSSLADLQPVRTPIRQRDTVTLAKFARDIEQLFGLELPAECYCDLAKVHRSVFSMNRTLKVED
jgi:transcriptional regulator with XRE-family HTH domain